MSEIDIRQRKVRLGDLLIQAGLLTDAQLQLALQDQKRIISILDRFDALFFNLGQSRHITSSGSRTSQC